MLKPESLVGKQIDQFRLDQYLARGAMGLVFKAFDTVLVRTVALKLIPKAMEGGLSKEELAAREEARKRLIQEAKAAGRLAHPNIVTIHSYGESDEYEYICMEYVTGETLSHMLRERKAVAVEDAVPIVEQVLLALQSANKEKIVHRDIKPSNIMVTPDKHVKVMDFGIAKLPSLSMTTTGTVLGTPYYMSPEQISGQKVDIRSDIFSLGAVFYEILTGERPFEAENTATLAYKIVQVEPIPPKILNIHIPAPVGGIISRALAKDPAMRYQSPGEMLADLKTLREKLAGTKGGEPGETTVLVARESAQTIRPPESELQDVSKEAPPAPSGPAPANPPAPAPPAVPPAIAAPAVKTAEGEGGIPAQQPRTSPPPPPPPPPPARASGVPAPGKEPPAVLDAQKKPAEEKQSVATGPPTATEARKTDGIPGLKVGTGKPLNLLRPVAIAALVVLVVVAGTLFLTREPSRTPQVAGTPAKTTPEAAPAAPSAQAPVDQREMRMKADTMVLQAKGLWQANPSGAQKILEEAASLDPNNYEAFFQLARLMTQKKDYPTALQYYQNALRIDSRAVDVYFNIGYIYLIQGDFDAAITHYEACRALNPSYQDEVLTNLGMCYLKKNNPEQAQTLFRQALALNPNNSVAKSYVAGLPASPQGAASTSPPSASLPPASPAAQAAVPGTGQQAQSADSLVLEAKNQWQSNPSAAQKLLEDAVSLDPNHFEAIYQLARLMTLKKDYAAAAQYYLAAQRLNSKSAEVYFNLGYIYLNQGDYDQAQENYEACLALSPSFKDEILTNLGIVHLKKNNPAVAKSMFLRALEANPKNKLAQSHLSNLNKPAAKPDAAKP